MRDRSRRGGALKRSVASKDLFTAHWVFCEGKTEERVIKDIRKHRRLRAVHVAVLAEVGTPWTIVEMAKRKADDLRRGPKGWKIYVVFDRDIHPRFQESIQRAKALGFVLGVSNPCIELWGLLLHKDQTAHIERGKAQSDLKKIHPPYCHKSNPYFDPDKVLAHRNDAKLRAKVLEKRAADAGDLYQNPSSSFYEVLDALFV